MTLQPASQNCRIHCFQQNYSVYNYQPLNRCLCGRLISGSCDHGTNQGYVDDTLAASVIQPSDLGPVSTTVGVHITLPEDLEYLYWSDIKTGHQSLVVDNQIRYRFPVAGHHELYLAPTSAPDEVIQVPVHVLDPVTSVRVDVPMYVNVFDPINMTLMVDQGTDVTITWSHKTTDTSLVTGNTLIKVSNHLLNHLALGMIFRRKLREFLIREQVYHKAGN